MKKILVIHNQQKARQLLKEELSDADYKIIDFETIEEALQVLGNLNPDSIIIETNVSESEKIKFMQKVKDQKGDIPIVLCLPNGHYKQSFQVWASDAHAIQSENTSELKLCLKEILNPIG